MAGFYLKHRFGIPWVADFRDPWVAGQDLTGSPKKMLFLDRLGESLVFRSADAVIVNAPKALSEVVAKYPQVAGRIHCVTNGFDPAIFAGLSKSSQSRFVICHPGELYAGRDPSPFLDAIQIVVGRDTALCQRLTADFIGKKSDGRVLTEAEIERRGLTGVVNLIGQVSYRESLQRMVDADLLLLIDTPNRRIGVPAKLYEYFGAKRPVLALANEGSDVHWALRESGVTFRLAATNDVQAIVSGLDFLLRNKAGQESESQSSRFSRAAITSQLAEILDQLPLSHFAST